MVESTDQIKVDLFQQGALNLLTFFPAHEMSQHCTHCGAMHFLCSVWGQIKKMRREVYHKSTGNIFIVKSHQCAPSLLTTVCTNSL